MATQLILALDYNNEKEALGLVDQLNAEDCALKVGNEMFTRLGPQFIKKLIDKQFKVFLDLKFHDIPNTVARACSSAADLGVWMLNVHASGGMKMMDAAALSLSKYGSQRPLLIAVTVLTSFSDSDLKEVGITNYLPEQVTMLAKMAENAGLDGVVCSAFESQDIKKTAKPQFITVCPGIRLDKKFSHDQTRVMTPREATAEGCDYIVMGRDITQAEIPTQVIQTVIQLVNIGTII